MGKENPISGYGPNTLSLLKKFDGDTAKYRNWELSFKSGLRLQNLHVAFDEHEDERPTEYNETSLKRDRRAIFDLLAMCLDEKSMDILSRCETEDGVLVLKQLWLHYLRQIIDEAKEEFKVIYGDSDSEHEFTFHLVSSKDDKISAVSDENLLLVDSGCTSHVIKNGANFNNFNKDFSPNSHSITMADGRKSRDSVKAIGSATETVIDFKGEEHDLVLNNALYIPDFKESIFSVYRSIKNGHTVVFSPEESYLLTKKGTKFDLVERNKLFYLKKHNNHEVKSVQKMEKKVGTHALLPPSSILVT